MVRDIQRQRRFPHRRPRRQDEQFAFAQTARHFIETRKARTDALDALIDIEKGVDAAFIFFNNLGRTRQRILRAQIAQLHEGVFSGSQNLLRVFFKPQAAIDRVLRHRHDAAQQRLLFDDSYIALQIVDCRQTVIERNQVAEAVHRLQLAMLHQLVRERNAIDLLAALVDLAHAQEDPLVLLDAEVVGGERPPSLQKRRLVAHDRAQHEPLRVQIIRKRSVKADVAYSHKGGLLQLAHPVFFQTRENRRNLRKDPNSPREAAMRPLDWKFCTPFPQAFLKHFRSITVLIAKP